LLTDLFQNRQHGNVVGNPLLVEIIWQPYLLAWHFVFTQNVHEFQKSQHYRNKTNIFFAKDSTPDTHQQIKMNVRNMTQEYLFEFSVGVPIPEIKKLVHAV